MITEQDIQTALRQLVDPNTQTDYVSSKSVKQIKVDGNQVKVEIVLGYPAKTQVAPLREAITAHLQQIPGVGQVAGGAGRRTGGIERDDERREAGGGRGTRKCQWRARGRGGGGRRRSARIHRCAGQRQERHRSKNGNECFTHGHRFPPIRPGHSGPPGI